jgi:hypothetical protein
MFLSSGFIKYKRSYLKRIESRSAPLGETQITLFGLATQQIFPYVGPLIMAKGVLGALKGRDGLWIWIRAAD